ncbi:MAG: tRNA(1)(Val) (adenine(37)-N(6))-methyltransferase [Firmicutes bacterium]|nr:tRNA(1)(Val) (adenine(37)-N(6))-methyltransferase [Bacillota bacterium]MDI6705108.1 tRNA1(Val) (adenine(37)-N6)-methyltransferase [Bacillota bacterium]
MEEFVKDGERVDDLQIGGLRIIQNPRKFCFGIDAVMLANFATVKKGDTVLDFGTGTGIIPLILAGKTKASRIIGIEIQEEMAEMAGRSVRMNRLEERIRIIHGDIRNIGEYVKDSSADLVVSNPPYMDGGHGLINPDDSKAIARHEIMCTLDDLIGSAAKVLKDGGRLALIHRSSRMVDVLSLMREKGIEPKKLRMIHSAVDKDSNLFLVEGNKSGGRFLKVQNPLIIYNQGQIYTDEIHSIYYNGERM